MTVDYVNPANATKVKPNSTAKSNMLIFEKISFWR